MLLLALDTATPSVVVGVIEVSVVEVSAPAESCWQPTAVRAAGSLPSTNRHAETVGQLIPDVLAMARISMADLSAIVVGLGPGPFTGLRVGIMTAAALADALGVAVHGVCTQDAIAAGYLNHAGPAPDAGFVVVTDARRKECYWADYDASGSRRSGPHVQRPAELLSRPEWRADGLVIGEPAFRDALGTPVLPAEPGPRGLVHAVGDALGGPASGGLEPLYLRRPDATPPSARKSVTPR